MISLNLKKADLNQISGQWSKLPREVVGSPLLEEFKKRQDMVLVWDNLGTVNPTSVQGVGLVDSEL